MSMHLSPQRIADRFLSAVATCLLATPVFFAAAAVTQAAETGSDAVPLSTFGAVGDGVTDDTEALRAAFAAGAPCLDGGSKTYAVNGTIRSQTDLCLRNIKLVQTMKPVDLTPYIRSGGKPPVQLDASGTLYHPEDPRLSDTEHFALERRNNLRTILVTGDRSSTTVHLENVTIQKGRYNLLGNGGHAAAIYIDSAVQVDLTDVDVHGRGQGYGIFVTASQGIRMTGVDVHDIVWSAPLGDHTFDTLRTQFGYNSVPMYEYDPGERRFRIVRSQERASGIVISESYDIVLDDVRVSEIYFETRDGMLPWQADGITVSNSKRVTIQNSRILQTWEGIDLSGQYVDDVVIRDIRITDSMTFALKMAHRVRGGVIENVVIDRAGISGVTIGGERGGGAANITLEQVTIRDVGGMVNHDGSVLKYNETAGAIGLWLGNENHPLDNPYRITMNNLTIANTDDRFAMDHGIVMMQPELSGHVLRNVQILGARLRDVLER